MVQAQNPAIKLFGKRIKLPPLIPVADAKADEYGEETEQDLSDERSVRDNGKVEDTSQHEQELTSSDTSLDSVNPKTPSIDEDISKTNGSNTDRDDSPKSQDKPPLKKPDKILPCPRCNSMDTKFCYYNNYNVNQPRHFCKACQRYWTAGGTMRNVPVGAGRRKSKSSASRYRHITISEVLQAAAQVDVAGRTHHHYPNLTPNGTVLTFGANQYDPMPAPVEKRAVNGIRNQSIGAKTVSHARVETQDERSSGNFPGKHSVPNKNGFVPQVPSLSNVPWPYAVPIPFFPTGFWACSNVSVPGPWNYPLVPPPISQNGSILCPNSQILGKHPRDVDTTKADCSSEPDLEKPRKNGSVLIPKTLRIDDPTDAAKSSIWTTLGIKSECGLFKGFKPIGKDKVKDRAFEGGLGKDRTSTMTESEDSRVLYANPAALSRSLNFHESS